MSDAIGKEDDDEDKPNVKAYFEMRTVREGDTNRIDEYLPSANPNGASPRKKKEPARKWKPTPTTENQRPDEWMGGGVTKQRSWKVKSISVKAPTDESDSEDDDKVPSAIKGFESPPEKNFPDKSPGRQSTQPKPKPGSKTSLTSPKSSQQQHTTEDLEGLTATIVQESTPPEADKADDDDNDGDSTKVEVDSDVEEEKTALAPKGEPKTSKTRTIIPKEEEDNDDKPNVKAYFEMRTVRDGDTNRIDEFLPSAYEASTRKKKESVRKWKPTPTTENQRPDEWMGGGVTKQRSWKVKSKIKSINVKAPTDESDNDDNESDDKVPSAINDFLKKDEDEEEEDEDKPNVKAYFEMRSVREGDTNRIDEYLPSANPYGASPRKKKEPARKWKPTPTTENQRPDEWMGGGVTKQRSWKVKSISVKAPTSDSEKEEEMSAAVATKSKSVEPSWKSKPLLSSPVAPPEKAKVPKKEAAATSAPVQPKVSEPPQVSEVEDDDSWTVEADSDSNDNEELIVEDNEEYEEVVVEDDDESTEVEIDSEEDTEKEEPKKEELKKEVPTITLSTSKDTHNVSFDTPNKKEEDEDKPNVKAYFEMRTVREGDTNRIDEYLPSANPYGAPSRKKKEPARKWKPTPTTENQRPDEWMGGGVTKQRSWKVKSISVKAPTDESDEE
jgi:hypothetical protein